MAPTAVQVTWNVEDASLAALGGTITFAPVAILGGASTATPVTITDSADSLVIAPSGVTRQLSVGTVELVPTDDGSLSPAGWMYQITTAVTGLPPTSVTCLIPHSPSLVDLSSLAPAVAVEATQPYLLGTYPGGTTEFLRGDGTWDVPAGGSGSLPGGATAGQVLTATDGTHSFWEPAAAPPVNLLIPAYQYPTTGALWADLTAAPAKYAVANISSGPGTGPANTDYTAAISAAQAAGVVVLGYVDTNFGAVSSGTVAANVALWSSLYGVTSIFLDRAAASTGQLSYYTTVTSAIRTASPSGTIVLNHGAIPNQGYAALGDILVVFENAQSAWSAFTPASWFTQYPPSKFAVLAYSASTQAVMSSTITQAQGFGIGNVYVTSDAGLWNTVPAYWAAEVAQSQASAGAVLGQLAVETARAEAAEAGLWPVYNVKAYGALCDGRMVSDAAMTNGSAVLACASSMPFTSAAPGAVVVVRGAGAAGADLVTTISGFTDTGHATLAANASTTVSAALASFGHDDTAAWNSAAAAAVAAAGGVVYLPGGWSVTTGAINLNGSHNVTLQGTGDTGGTPSRILVLGTGAFSAVSAQNSSRLVLRRIAVQSVAAAYTGILADLRNVSGLDSALARIEGCTIGGTAGALTPTGIALTKCDSTVIDGCYIANCATGILGLGTSGDYANEITIRNTELSSNGAYHIHNPGNGWNLHGNTIEALGGGAAGGIISDSGLPAYGVTITGNWFGDITASGGTQVSVNGAGFVITGNYIGFNTGNTGIAVAANSAGFRINGNRFDAVNGVTAISLGSGCSGYDISGNSAKQSMTFPAPLTDAMTAGTLSLVTPLPVGSGGTGAATQAAAITALTGTQSAGKVLRSDGTSATLSAIQAADVPTLNQNTSGTAAGLSATLAIGSGGTGSATRNFAGLLTPTAVKTGNYSAAAGDLVPCDTTSAGFTVTLPAAPADLSVVGIKHVIQGAANAVTYACAGSDVFNKTGGGTSGTLALPSQGVLLQYRASGAIWYVVSDDLPLSQLDARYLALAGGTLTGALTLSADPASGLQPASQRYAQALVAESPADRGLIAWTFPPSQIITETISTSNLPSGDIGLTKIWVRKAQTITNIVLAIGNAIGASLTSSENFIGLYDSTGTQRGVSADQTTAWTTTGNKNTSLVIPLTSPYAAAAGFYWIAYLVNGTTGPTLCFAASNNSSQVNFGLTSSTFYAGFIGGSATVLPASFTPSSVGTGHGGSFAFLAGLS